MTNESASSRRVLEPMDRLSEVLFGLIMVLTFTGTLSVTKAGQADVKDMLTGALGCNIAWGLIDAMFYLMSALAEKGRNLRTLRAVRRTADPREAQQLLAGSLPPTLAHALEPAEYAAMHQRLKRLPEPPRLVHLGKDDWLGAAAIFFLVFLSTFPVVIPFLFMHEIASALRVSNAIAIAMLAATGAAFGRIAGRNPWVRGIAMVVLGMVLVAVTIALGG